MYHLACESTWLVSPVRLGPPTMFNRRRGHRSIQISAHAFCKILTVLSPQGGGSVRCLPANKATPPGTTAASLHSLGGFIVRRHVLLLKLQLLVVWLTVRRNVRRFGLLLRKRQTDRVSSKRKRGLCRARAYRRGRQSSVRNFHKSGRPNRAKQTPTPKHRHRRRPNSIQHVDGPVKIPK